MIRVLGRQTSGNVQKVLFFLEEIGLKYTREDYGRQFNNTNTDAYRQLNPNMKVPTVVDGDLVIWELHTILRYLAALHQPKVLGATPPNARMWSAGWIGCWRRSTRLMSLSSRTPRSRRPSVAPTSRRKAPTLWRSSRFLDGHITAKSWFALDQLTLADIALGPIVARCLDFPIERPPFAELTRWMKAIQSRPAFVVATGAKPSALNAA